MSWVCPRLSSDLPLGKGGVGSLIYRGEKCALGYGVVKVVYIQGAYDLALVMIATFCLRNMMVLNLFLAADSGRGSFSQETELFIGLGFCTKGCQEASLLKSSGWVRDSPGEGIGLKTVSPS